jgi:hypothetical protein
MLTPHKDTFRTRSYRGGYIHTCVNRDSGRAEVRCQLPSGRAFLVASQRAAEMAINSATK